MQQATSSLEGLKNMTWEKYGVLENHNYEIVILEAEAEVKLRLRLVKT